MARLTDTLQQQTKEIVSETAQKRKKREAKEKIKNLAYNVMYIDFYKQQEAPALVYLKYSNIKQRQKFLNDLPAIYKIQNDYINEQEVSEIYTKELNRLFKVFKENKKYIEQKDLEYMQEQEAEQTEKETQSQSINKVNYIYNALNQFPTLEFLGALGTICIEFAKIPLALVSFMFSFTTEMAKPYRKRRR